MKRFFAVFCLNIIFMVCPQAQTNEKSLQEYEIWWSRLNQDWKRNFKVILNENYKGRKGYPDINQFEKIFRLETIKLAKNDKTTFCDLRDLASISSLKKIVVENKIINDFANIETFDFEVILHDNILLMPADSINTKFRLEKWYSNLSSRWKNYFSAVVNDRKRKGDFDYSFSDLLFENELTIDGKNFDIDDLSGLTSLTNLTTIYLRNLSLKNISGIENLGNKVIWDCYNVIFDMPATGFDKRENTRTNVSTFVYERARLWWASIDKKWRSYLLSSLTLTGNVDELSNASLYNLFANINVVSIVNNREIIDYSKDYSNDFHFLNNLTRLKAIKINYYYISNINFLSNHYSLNVLDLNNSNLNNLDGILNTKSSLEILSCNNNAINNLNILKNFSKLRILMIESNGIKDISPIASLDKLEILMCGSNTITNIQPIKNLIRLKILRLSYNKITDISSLGKLTQLQKFFIESNDVSDVLVLKNYPYIRLFNCDNNNISNLEPLLRAKDNLEILSCRNNKLNSMGFLLGFRSLKFLDFGENQVASLEFLPTLDSLIILSCHKNNITELPKFSENQLIEQIWISHNNLSSLDNLRNLKKLHTLSASYNMSPFKKKDLLFLSTLENLRTVYLFSSGVGKDGILLLKELNFFEKIINRCVY